MSEKELLEKIEKLEKRVEELEKDMATVKEDMYVFTEDELEDEEKSNCTRKFNILRYIKRMDYTYRNRYKS